MFFSAILLFFFVFRGFLFLGHSDPLGYDTGLYAKYIDMAYTALPQLPFQISLPDWPWGLYIITDFLRWIGFSQRQNFFLVEEFRVVCYNTQKEQFYEKNNNKNYNKRRYKPYQ